MSSLSPGVQGRLEERDFFPAGLFSAGPWIKQRWLSSLFPKPSGQLLVLPHFLSTHAEDAKTWPATASQIKLRVDYGSMKEALEKTWTSYSSIWEEA